MEQQTASANAEIPEPQPVPSPAEVTLLGLLAEGPSHPWELSKQVEYREMRTWSELSQSTIYKQLRALQARGLVDATEESVSGRLRHSYSITPAGRGALAEGILALLSQPTYPRWPVDIATYNVDQVEPAEAVGALATYAEILRGRAGDWGRLVEFLRGSGCPAHRWALADRARYMIEGELRWVEEFRASLQDRAESQDGASATPEPQPQSGTVQP